MKQQLDVIQVVQKKLHEISTQDINIMEVCGTHTMSLAKHAIRSLLPDTINIISGPGCPVCVTSAADIQAAIDLANKDDFIITTFGDMMKVPGKQHTLQSCKNVKVVYSPLDALKLATNNPSKQIVFLGIGFETTAPLIASTIKQAKSLNLSNFTVLSMHKTVPTALEVILGDKQNKISGLLLPGHVSGITGRKYFDFIKRFEVSGVVAGFDALDIMEAIYLLCKYFEEGSVEVTNNYKTLVTEEGNKLAMQTLYEVFEDADASWRGIGVIPTSGLTIRDEFSHFDAIKRFNLTMPEISDPQGCICGSILMGKAKPNQCQHFKVSCTPGHPVGPCMVSSEGTCAAFYKYNV
ncbi:MAG: hydrogenase formation protein HypD [Bacteriovoracaceae bacterium]|nr:hydrogenase formation protein HypD [Bacteriovoracaceae bacterium]